jgi:hypothetical protein
MFIMPEKALLICGGGLRRILQGRGYSLGYAIELPVD